MLRNTQRSKIHKTLNAMSCGLSSLKKNTDHPYGSISQSTKPASNKYPAEINSSSIQNTNNLASDLNSEASIQQTQTRLSNHKIIVKSVEKAAAKYNLPPELIQAVIKAESNFKVNAVSSAGAQGLMQLMPATAKELGVNNPFDIDQNVDGGSWYLSKMIDRFGGDIKLALAAYNAGPGTVERYKDNVPYLEKKHLLNRVLRFSGQFA